MSEIPPFLKKIPEESENSSASILPWTLKINDKANTISSKLPPFLKLSEKSLSTNTTCAATCPPSIFELTNLTRETIQREIKTQPFKNWSQAKYQILKYWNLTKENQLNNYLDQFITRGTTLYVLKNSTWQVALTSTQNPITMIWHYWIQYPFRQEHFHQVFKDWCEKHQFRESSIIADQAYKLNKNEILLAEQVDPLYFVYVLKFLMVQPFLTMTTELPQNEN